MNQGARPADMQGGPFALVENSGSGRGGGKAFSRHRYEFPLLGMFGVIALIELVVVHLLVAQWSVTAATILSALTLLAMVQLGWLMRCMALRPTLVDRESILVRHGGRGEILVPMAAIESIEDVSFAPEEKGLATFRASLLAQPNVVLRLREPLAVGKRRVSTIALRLDDGHGFMREVAARKHALGPAHKPEPPSPVSPISS